MKERVLKKQTAIMFAIAILLVASMGLFLFELGKKFLKSEQARIAPREIILQTQAIESLSKDSWGASRGYIITGEDDFLEPYATFIANINTPIVKLREATKNHKALHSLISELIELVEKRRNISDKVIALRKENGFEAARKFILTREGKNNMDSIRLKCEQITKIARADLLKISNAHKKDLNSTFFVFLILISSVFVILLISYFYINRAYTKVAVAEYELMALNKKLDEKVRKRTGDLAHQVDQFHVLTESLPQIIWTADQFGNTDYMNKQWIRFTGLDTTDIDNKLGEIIHPDDLPDVDKAWQQALQKKSVYEVDYRMRRYDGQYCWFLVRAFPMKDDHGNVYKWLGTCTDIDQQKKLSEMKDDFINLTSHELRTPITTIKAYIQLLERCVKEDNNSDTEEYLRKTHVFVDRLSVIVNDLHETSKASAGKLQLQKTEFNCKDFLTDMVEVLQQTSTSHNIKYVGDADIRLLADRGRLEQVMTNYISNAVKYSPGAKEIIVDAKHEDDFMIVSVQDFGLGIPKNKQDKIFNRFFRATNVQSIEGLGLGLYLSRKIIGAHGGKTWVESEEGKGSTFYFCVPIG